MAKCASKVAKKTKKAKKYTTAVPLLLRGGGAVGPLSRFFGGFDIVYRGEPEVIMDPKRKGRRSSRSDLLYQIRSW